MKLFDKSLLILVGHYGSGKTNLAVNLALDAKKNGRQVAVADMDIVNPYFRTADFDALFASHGIETVNPPFARSNVDLPTITAQIDGLLARPDLTVILDIGGDDAGAAILGRYANQIKERGDYCIFYVINQSRYLTCETDDTLQVLKEIEHMARLKATGIINNTHLAEETTKKLVEDSVAYAKETAEKAGIPLVCTSVKRELAMTLLESGEDIYPVDIFVKTPW